MAMKRSKKTSGTKSIEKKARAPKVKAVEATVEKESVDAAAAQADDSGEICVFAIRLRRAERDLIHQVAGSGKASEFVRGLAIAGARKDMKAVEEIVDAAHAAR